MNLSAEYQLSRKARVAHGGLFALAFWLLLVGHPRSIWAQSISAFQNLDFEAANLPSIPTNQFGGFVPISQAMPGWTGYLGGESTSQVLQNNVSTGAAEISIYGPHFAIGLYGIIDGKYTAVLESGGSAVYLPATLSQVGIIPVGTESLQMKVGPGETGFTVTLGGQSLSMVPLQFTPFYTIYGGSVPVGVAGQGVVLSITCLPLPTNPYNTLTLDDITFSASPVPEPEAGWLLIAGGATLSIAGRLAARAKRSGATKATSAADVPNAIGL